MNALAPILLFGTGIVLVAKSRKKKKRGGEGASFDLSALPDGSASVKDVPKVVSNWAQRQEALKFLAFQACARITVDGKWGEQTERAMLEMLRKLDREGLPTPKPGPTPSPDESKKWTPDDIIVMDPQCNQMIYIDDRLFDKQRRLAAEYALDGNTTFADAQAIHQEMVEEYSPLCASLGKDGVGAGVKTWWDQNVKWIYNVLREYEMLPNALEEDAEAFGLL